MPKLKTSEPYIRKNISIPPDFEADLEHLRQEYGFPSHSELIRFAVKQLMDGGFIERRQQRKQKLQKATTIVAAE